MCISSPAHYPNSESCEDLYQRGVLLSARYLLGQNNVETICAMNGRQMSYHNTFLRYCFTSFTLKTLDLYSFTNTIHWFIFCFPTDSTYLHDLVSSCSATVCTNTSWNYAGSGDKIFALDVELKPDQEDINKHCHGEAHTLSSKVTHSRM